MKDIEIIELKALNNYYLAKEQKYKNLLFLNYQLLNKYKKTKKENEYLWKLINIYEKQLNINETTIEKDISNDLEIDDKIKDMSIEELLEVFSKKNKKN